MSGVDLLCGASHSVPVSVLTDTFEPQIAKHHSKINTRLHLFENKQLNKAFKIKCKFFRHALLSASAV
jgi:hypothetical protein